MSRVDLAGVLAAHREDLAYRDTCVCQDEAAPESERLGQYPRHVADAIAAHIGAVLDGLREDAAGAVYEAESYFGSTDADLADAVLGVVRAAMGLETASQPAQGTNRAAGEDECHQGADDEGEARV